VNAERAAGVVLILAPLWFNTNFALLGKRFNYPDILRRPATEILERFRAGGRSLILLWWMFMLWIALDTGRRLARAGARLHGDRPARRDRRRARWARPDTRTPKVGLPRSFARSYQR
jgi:hypothetical protein